MLLKLDTFTKPVQLLIFRSSCSSSVLFTHLITALQYLMEDIGRVLLSSHRDLTSLTMFCNSSEKSLRHHESQRVSHYHPQYCMMQLPMTPRLHSGKLVDRFSTFVISTLLFLSTCLVISILPQLSFEDGQDSYFGVVGRFSVDIY